MSEYHKIITAWKRDPANRHKTLLRDEWATPEFEALASLNWTWEEKVDGTNVRVIWDGHKVRFGGRTDNAQMPTFLLDRLMELFPEDAVEAVFGESAAVLYGEGYGAKIQKGGGSYIPDGCSLALFDVRVGEFWLKRIDVDDVAGQLSLTRAPFVGVGPLGAAMALAESGFASRLRDTDPEGLVMRPPVDLFTRAGKRVIAKVKIKDFA